MRRAVKFTVAGLVALLCLGFALFEYASRKDQENFSAAKNKCEVGCVQDSGGIDQCRKYCTQHPDHYP